MREAQLRLLSALHEATRQSAIRWTRADDDDRDIYQAAVGEAQIEIEFVYVHEASGEHAERFVARFSGLGVYFQVAIGTRPYDAISAMLSLQIHGWAEGRSGGLRSLARATAQVEALISAHPREPS
jgi:hypothetical protein